MDFKVIVGLIFIGLIFIGLIFYLSRKFPSTNKQGEQDNEDYSDSSISEEREIVLVKILKKETLNEEEICTLEDILDEIIEEHRRYGNEQKQ